MDRPQPPSTFREAAGQPTPGSSDLPCLLLTRTEAWPTAGAREILAKSRSLLTPACPFLLCPVCPQGSKVCETPPDPLQPRGVHRTHPEVSQC